jgi:8-oxo-dGTP pyrophosphatase MutT (NUDIX family)
MHSAGVLIHDGRGHVLLGLQRGRWASFSGKAEPGETPAQTATRECHEETLFVLGERLRDLDAHPRLESITPKGHVFHLYVLRLEHDAALPGAFERVRAAQTYRTAAGCNETDALMWLRWDDLPRLRLRSSLRNDLARVRRIVQTQSQNFDDRQCNTKSPP